MYKTLTRILVIIMSFLLVACSLSVNTNSNSNSSGSPLLGSRVVVWHTWGEAEAKVLDQLLEKFTAINKVTVISLPLRERLLEADKDSDGPVALLQALPVEFIAQAALGLGPDILIGPGEWSAGLYEEGLIQDISGRDEMDEIIELYLSAALNQVRIGEQLVGLPISLQTEILYYNKKMVSQPPTTLQELLDQAVDGKAVALNTNFLDAFWGVQAFGGQLFDEQGRAVLNQGGFANWLDWLKQAQEVPNMTLSHDIDTLDTLFKEGQVAYYVANSALLPELQEALGDDVGVALLPSGPTGNPAGPFLTADVMMFNAASSTRQTEEAIKLARFLSNVEQQTKLAQQTGQVPANSQVRIDRRAFPVVATLIGQSKTAVPVPNMSQLSEIIAYGDEIYTEVLEGVLNVSDAAASLIERVNSDIPLETVSLDHTLPCSPGTIDVWYNWAQSEAAALNEVRRDFMSRCPESFIHLININIEEERQLKEASHLLEQGEGPDLFIVSNKEFRQLISQGLVRDISDLVERDFLQQFVPVALEDLRTEGKLYGLPVSMQMDGLYYNKQLVSTPPIDLDDLLNQVDSEHPVVIQVGITDAYWGMSAFGGKLFDAEGRLALNEGAFANWLSWLQEAQNQPGILLKEDQREAFTLFAEGKAAYFAGHKKWLSELQSILGEDELGVTPLPSGPLGASAPLLSVQAVMLSAKTIETQNDLALEFAKYVTSVESQSRLVKEANIVPANVNVDTSQNPAIAGFLEQAKTAVNAPKAPQTSTIFDWGNTIYENVLENNLNPDEVLANFTKFVNETHGIVLEGQEPVADCQEAGELLLWHSWPDAVPSTTETEVLTSTAQSSVPTPQTDSLTQLITEFNRYCPDVQVIANYVGADELPNRLSAALDAGTSPDFFLAPHDLIEPLSDKGLIKPITSLLNRSALIGYLPEAMSALEYEQEFYGLPQSMTQMALYSNTDLVKQPASTVNDLFASASPESPLALDSSFYGAFWGISTFSEALFNEQGQLMLEPSDLVQWLEALQVVSQQAGILFSSDQEELQKLFATGKVAYMVAGPEALKPLTKALGAKKIQVTALPSGLRGEASSFLEIEAFLFSGAARETQTKLALTFAQFATSGANQALLAQSANLVPTNSAALAQLKDSQLINFVRQSRNSLLLPPRPQNLLLFEAGDKLYQDVLEKGIEPTQAMNDFLSFITDTPEPDIITQVAEASPLCQEGSQLLLWHSWPETQTVVLSPTLPTEVLTPTTPSTILGQIIDEFTAQCAGVEIEALYVPADDLFVRLANPSVAERAADLILATHDYVVPLSEQGLIKPITPFVDEALLAEYLPNSLTAFEDQGIRYGLPQSMDVMALYYNTELVTNTVSTLDELLTVAISDTQIAFDSSFSGTFWGLSTFGEQLLDEQGTLNEDGLQAWFAWLEQANNQDNIVFSADQKELEQRFADGEVAYLVAGSDALPSLRAKLGQALGVTALPAGPYGEAKPFLQVEGFLLTSAASEQQSQLAFAFAKFATSEAYQTLLAQQANLIPSNKFAITLLYDPAITSFVKQAESSTLLPDPARRAALEATYNAYLERLFGE